MNSSSANRQREREREKPCLFLERQPPVDGGPHRSAWSWWCGWLPPGWPDARRHASTDSCRKPASGRRLPSPSRRPPGWRDASAQPFPPEPGERVLRCSKLGNGGCPPRMTSHPNEGLDLDERVEKTESSCELGLALIIDLRGHANISHL